MSLSVFGADIGKKFCILVSQHLVDIFSFQVYSQVKDAVNLTIISYNLTDSKINTCVPLTLIVICG